MDKVMNMTLDEKREKAITDIEKFRTIVALQINKEDPSSISHQLTQLHNNLPAAIEARERMEYFLIKEKAMHTITHASKPMNAEERINLIKADASVTGFYYGWIAGLITEAHQQIIILTSLLNNIK